MNLKQKIFNSKPYKSGVELTQKIILPGFGKIPLFDVLTFFIKAMQDGALNMRASSLAYNFFMALFPGILFIFTLIPFIPIDNFQTELMAQLQAILPAEAFKLSQETINDLVTNKKGELLSFGFIAGLFFATNGVNAMLDSFEHSAIIIKKRKAIQQRIAAIVLTLGLTLIVFAVITLIIISHFGLNWIFEYGILKDKSNLWLLQIADWISLISLIYFANSFIYFYGAEKESKWKFFSPGSTLATVLMLLTSVGFAWYVNNFGSYNKLYGSIGTLIVIMLFLYLNSFVILIGFELNTSIRNARVKFKSRTISVEEESINS